MNIRPSAAIRQNYNEIADLCRETAEPIFLTKNGEGDLVVMDIETYNRREKMLKLREELLSVEEDRIKSTKEHLISAGAPDNYTLLLESHTQMKTHAPENSVSCITFNLGYLPGGDHAKATKGDTSIEALTQGLSLLRKGGLISLCIYSGGDSGFEERDAVLAWLASLDPHKYLVIRSDYYNRPNNPPIPVLIIKL